jgi:hypothetical protein
MSSCVSRMAITDVRSEKKIIRCSQVSRFFPFTHISYRHVMCMLHERHPRNTNKRKRCMKAGELPADKCTWHFGWFTLKSVKKGAENKRHNDALKPFSSHSLRYTVKAPRFRKKKRICLVLSFRNSKHSKHPPFFREKAQHSLVRK